MLLCAHLPFLMSCLAGYTVSWGFAQRLRLCALSLCLSKANDKKRCDHLVKAKLIYKTKLPRSNKLSLYIVSPCKDGSYLIDRFLDLHRCWEGVGNHHCNVRLEHNLLLKNKASLKWRQLSPHCVPCAHFQCHCQPWAVLSSVLRTEHVRCLKSTRRRGTIISTWQTSALLGKIKPKPPSKLLTV